MKYTIDATDKSLGRLATEVARLLIGKHKISYVPYKDLGDQVIIKNINKLKLSPAKIEQKKYYYYSGYPGGLKIRKFSEIFQKNPAKAFRRVVFNMLPKNKLRKLRLKKLIIEK